MPDQRSSFVILDERDDLKDIGLPPNAPDCARKQASQLLAIFSAPKRGRLEPKSVTTSRFFLAD